jgi:hypothetical protein
MAKEGKGNQSSIKGNAQIIQSRSIPLAEAGPKSVMQIAEFSLAVATDAVRGLISANTANATSSAIGKTLKAIELQLKHGPKDGVAVMLR